MLSQRTLGVRGVVRTMQETRQPQALAAAAGSGGNAFGLSRICDLRHVQDASLGADCACTLP